MTTTTTTSVRWAWEKAIRDDGNLSRNAKLLGYTLGTFMDVRGRCRPGKAKLTEALCFTSHKSLEPCRSELRKAGYVTITRHIGRPTEYRATTPNPLGSGPAETQTKTSNIANLLSQPANERVSQPANERSRTDHKTTDHLKSFSKGLSSFDDESLDEESLDEELVSESALVREPEKPAPSPRQSSRPLFEAALFPLRVRATRIGDGGYQEVVVATLHSPADAVRQRSFGYEFEPVTA
jgi:hypothetical protein